eukprot:gene15178-16740_t
MAAENSSIIDLEKIIKDTDLEKQLSEKNLAVANLENEITKLDEENSTLGTQYKNNLDTAMSLRKSTYIIENHIEQLQIKYEEMKKINEQSREKYKAKLEQYASKWAQYKLKWEDNPLVTKLNTTKKQALDFEEEIKESTKMLEKLTTKKQNQEVSENMNDEKMDLIIKIASCRLDTENIRQDIQKNQQILAETLKEEERITRILFFNAQCLKTFVSEMEVDSLEDEATPVEKSRKERKTSDSVISRRKEKKKKSKPPNTFSRLLTTMPQIFTTTGFGNSSRHDTTQQDTTQHDPTEMPLKAPRYKSFQIITEPNSPQEIQNSKGGSDSTHAQRQYATQVGTQEQIQPHEKLSVTSCGPAQYIGEEPESNKAIDVKLQRGSSVIILPSKSNDVTPKSSKLPKASKTSMQPPKTIAPRFSEKRLLQLSVPCRSDEIESVLSPAAAMKIEKHLKVDNCAMKNDETVNVEKVNKQSDAIGNMTNADDVSNGDSHGHVAVLSIPCDEKIGCSDTGEKNLEEKEHTVTREIENEEKTDGVSGTAQEGMQDDDIQYEVSLEEHDINSERNLQAQEHGSPFYFSPNKHAQDIKKFSFSPGDGFSLNSRPMFQNTNAMKGNDNDEEDRNFSLSSSDTNSFFGSTSSFVTAANSFFSFGNTETSTNPGSDQNTLQQANQENNNQSIGGLFWSSPNNQQQSTADANNFSLFGNNDVTASQRKDVEYTANFIAALTETVWKQMEIFSKDLEDFARHAKRRTILPDDVKLLARRSPVVVSHLCEFHEDMVCQVSKKRAKKQKLSDEHCTITIPDT